MDFCSHGIITPPAVGSPPPPPPKKGKKESNPRTQKPPLAVPAPLSRLPVLPRCVFLLLLQIPPDSGPRLPSMRLIFPEPSQAPTTRPSAVTVTITVLRKKPQLSQRLANFSAPGPAPTAAALLRGDKSHRRGGLCAPPARSLRAPSAFFCAEVAPEPGPMEPFPDTGGAQSPRSPPARGPRCAPSRCRGSGAHEKGRPAVGAGSQRECGRLGGMQGRRGKVVFFPSGFISPWGS